ncbi:MAG: hypothetical protein E5W91_22720 [Mesorhizobium sp.]|nr:MAG: hypothetical protein E5W91_22720 [Mesorhizobium sp.]
MLIDAESHLVCRAVPRSSARTRSPGSGPSVTALDRSGRSNRTSVDLADDEGVVSAVRLDTLTPLHRQRVVTPAGEPLPLWLNEAGRPMTPAAWAAVFRRASARCCRAGLDLVVTPHALRHTFAVHMLSMLIHEQIGSVLTHGPTDDPGSAAYRRSISPARCVPCRTEEQTGAHRGTHHPSAGLSDPARSLRPIPHPRQLLLSALARPTGSTSGRQPAQTTLCREPDASYHSIEISGGV